MKCVLGIDTSCYTTSIALLREDGSLAGEARRILTVKSGGRGLAQSEMVFQHTRNLPQLFDELLRQLGERVEVQAVGVSAFPRSQPDSYMPAFLVGDGYAKVLSLTLDIPLQRISHQENHILAGMWSAGGPTVERYLALHVSGGTTEIVEVVQNKKHFAINLLGGSTDLHAGQFVDRVGVALSLPFPAGPHLEHLAETAGDNCVELPVAVQGMTVSFSGPESQAQRLVAQGVAAAELAQATQRCIGESLSRMIRNATQHTHLKDVLLVGGVASNKYIRQYIRERLAKYGTTLYFPEHKYSPDNAVGAAFSALKP